MAATEDRLKTLMLQGLDGDAAAHRQLLAELGRALRGYYARALGAGESDVEDLVQETLIAVHVRRESYERSRSFTTWAFAIARYKLIDHYRHRKLWDMAPLEDADDLFAVDESEGATAAHDLERLMREVTPQQREAIRYVKLEGLSVEEAAKRSGLSPANVKVSVHRGLQKLVARVRRDQRDAD